MEDYTEDLSTITEAAAKFTAASNKVETEAPDPTDIDLPGGIIDDEGVLTKYAVVRELNGFDEELIAKSSSSAKALNTILVRGTVSVGSREPVEADFKNMLSGDRDMLLLAIRKITFGNTVDYEITCPQCVVRNTVTIHLNKDVSVKYLEDPTDRVFEVKLRRGGVAKVKLPNVPTQTKVLEASEKNNTEAITSLLAGCLLSVNDEPAIGEHTARSLSSGDRLAIVDEIIARNPGPRLGEVNKACEACGVSMTIPLSLADLFRI